MHKAGILFAFYLLSAQRVTAVSVVSGGVEYVGHVAPDVDTQEEFLGIPFASAGRFERPQPPKVTTTFNAAEWGAVCPQLAPTPGAVQSEDCLNLNIWRPLGVTPKSKLPVMVWIYGGSFTHGAATEFPMGRYGAVAKLKGKPIIGVNFNYRTGVYGFPIGSRAEKNKALNLGLYDQRAALEWVQKHIADFGGDPSRVTLFGHSSGAVSVGLQMLYKGGNLGGAFRHAIMESGSPNTFAASPASTPGREVAYSFLVNNTNCATAADTFACLKSASYDTLNTAHIASYRYLRNYVALDYGWSAYLPVVTPGDSFLPIRPYEAIKAGAFAKIPMITGTSLDEGTIITPVPQTKQDTIDFFTTSVPGSDFGFADDIPVISNLVNKVYPDDPALGSPYGTGAETFNTSQYWKQATSITGDILFEAPRRFFLREAVKRGLNVWSYHWMQHSGLTNIFLPKYGIPHAQEIFAQFRNNPNVSSEALNTGLVFTDYFSSFAYSGSASTAPDTSLPRWEKYNVNSTSLQFRYNEYKMVKDNWRTSQIDTVISTLLVDN